MHRIVDTPAVARQAVGQMIPYVFGAMRKVRAIPALTAAQGTLREAMTAALPANGGSVLLSSLDELLRFPQTGTIQIDGERISYTGRDTTPGGVAFTGIARAVGSTAADHGLGTTVWQVVASHVYVLCENPGDHRVSSVDAVYVNGVVKAASTVPTHIINLDDQTLFFDTDTGAPLSVVSITFDLSTLAASQSQLINPSVGTVTSTAPLQRFVQQQVRTFIGYYSAPAGSVQGSGGFGGFGASGSGDGTTATISPVTTTTPTAPRSSSFTPRIFPAPQVGEVQVDVVGLKDDVSGTITGTPSALITLPAHVTRCLLREAFEQRVQGTSFDLPSWTEAATLQQSYTLAWALVFTPVDYGEFQRLVSFQSRTDVYLDPIAGWRAVFRRRQAPTYTSDTTRRIDLDYKTTQAQGIRTSLTVTYGDGESQADLMVFSVTNFDRSSKRTETVSMPWIASEQVARTMGAFQLSLRDHVRREATLTEAWNALGVTRIDGIAITHPALAVYGSDLAWRVRGFRVRPDGSITLDCEEETLASENWLRVNDTLRVGLTEAVSLSTVPGPGSVGDGLALGLSESAAIAFPVLLTVSDTLSVKVSDAATILVPVQITAADTVSITVSEATLIGLGLFLTVGDTVSIKASEATAILVPTLLSASDTLSVQITETASVSASSGGSGGDDAFHLVVQGGGF